MKFVCYHKCKIHRVDQVPYLLQLMNWCFTVCHQNVQQNVTNCILKFRSFSGIINLDAHPFCSDQKYTDSTS